MIVYFSFYCNLKIVRFLCRTLYIPDLSKDILYNTTQILKGEDGANVVSISEVRKGAMSEFLVTWSSYSTKLH